MAGCSKAYCSPLEQSSASVPSWWADGLPGGVSKMHASPILWLCRTRRLLSPLHCASNQAKREGRRHTCFRSFIGTEWHTLILHTFHWQGLIGWCHQDVRGLGTLLATGWPLYSHNFVQIWTGSLPFSALAFTPYPFCSLIIQSVKTLASRIKWGEVAGEMAYGSGQWM